METIQEILHRAESNISLHQFSDDEIVKALQAATRSIHNLVLQQEVKRRKRENRKSKKAKKTHRLSRSETTLDKMAGIMIGTHDEFGHRLHNNVLTAGSQSLAAEA